MNWIIVFAVLVWDKSHTVTTERLVFIESGSQLECEVVGTLFPKQLKDAKPNVAIVGVTTACFKSEMEVGEYTQFIYTQINENDTREYKPYVPQRR